jgi:hypothetical protein
LSGAVKLPVKARRPTVCERTELVLAWNCGEPLYCAVTSWGLDSADNAELVQLAVFPVSGTFPQIGVVPLLKVTVPTPVGLPSAAVTAAVNVITSPYVEGLLPLARDVLVA